MIIIITDLFILNCQILRTKQTVSNTIQEPANLGYTINIIIVSSLKWYLEHKTDDLRLGSQDWFVVFFVTELYL